MPEEQKVTRKLRAILSADVKGYSLLMADDEAFTIKTLKKHRSIMSTLIEQYTGRVVDSPGDNVLAEFASAVDVVQCAVEIQKVLKEKNQDLPDDKKLEFRIGVNIGDVVQDGDRIYGSGVNVAARIEGLAEPGGVCISRNAYDHIKDKLKFGYEYLGDHAVKNIKDPVRVYKVLTGAKDAGKLIGEKSQRYRKKWPGLAVATVAILIGIIVWQFYYEKSPPIEAASIEKMAFPLPDKPSIAVLPFDYMSGDPEQEFFCDGLTEDIITALSKIPDLFIIARNSVFTYKGNPVKIKQVAEELGVRYVLEGSVRTSEDKVRITAQLIDALEGGHLWAENFDRNLEDVFSLQDEITMKVLTALQVKLTEGQKIHAMTKSANNLKAYLKWVEGRKHFLLLNRDDNVKAKQLLEEAIAIDPEFSSPYVDLAWTNMLDIRYRLSKSPKESLGRATQLAQKAISLDESSPFAQSVLGAIFLAKGQYDNAIVQGEKAVAVSPGDSLSIAQLGRTLAYAGRYEESLARLEKAIRLDPIALNWYSMFVGHCYLFLERFEEAIEILEKILNNNPKNIFARIRLTAAYSLLGRDEDASTEAEEILEQNPKFTLESIKKLPIKNKEDSDLILNALRKAGLPDKPPLPLPDKPSIAVLAFDNLSGDPDQEYFSDGITEEIISALSKTDHLFVIARNSSFVYKGKPVDVKQVSRELGVRYVLEGSVRKSEDRVRITAQLIDATSGHHLWSERYDRDLQEIFVLQDEITMKIVTALQVKLTEGEQIRMWAKKYENLDVLLKAMELRSLWGKGTIESHMRYGQIAQEVINMAPKSSIGYRCLGWHYWVLANMGKSPRENLKKSFGLAQKAISLNESESLTYALLGSIYLSMKQFEKAIAAGEKSIELDPNGAILHGLLGQTLSFTGKPDEAIKYINKGIRLNPFPDYWFFRDLGRCYLLKKKFDEALTAYKKALQLAPDSPPVLNELAVAYILLDREEEARATATRCLELAPFVSISFAKKLSRYKNEADLKLFVDAMRKAGFPE